MQNEIWKDVIGFENDYEVSDFGAIRSKVRARNNGRAKILLKSKLLKQRISGYGYYIIDLHSLGYVKTISVHRVILSAFSPNTFNKPCINHINGIKTDNRLENLEWCTYSENSIHASKTGLTPYFKGDKARYTKPVICNNTSKVYGTIKEYAESINKHASYVTRVLNGTYKNTLNISYYEKTGS